MNRTQRNQDEKLANGSLILWSRKNSTHVLVICGSCGLERLVTVEKVAYHPFSGLCRNCGITKRREDEMLDNGSMICWSRRNDPYIPVICGGCHQERLLEYTGVTRDDFTGLCRDCANNVSRLDEVLNDGSTIFWSQRKGMRVKVQCGHCRHVRNIHAASIRHADSGFCKSCSNLGERANNWRGGRVMRGGYVEVRISPDHPFYNEMVLANGYVREHRLVMAEHLGRPLHKDEVVHHKNGNKTDNRIENLELYVSFQEHGKKLQERLPHPGHVPTKQLNRILALVKKMLREEENTES